MGNKDDNLIPDVGRLFEKAVNLYETAAKKKKGKILFVAGEAGSGRSDILRELGIRFAQLDQQPKIFTGRFRDNRYEINLPEEKINIQKILLAAGGSIGTIAKFMNPAAGMVTNATIAGTGIFVDFLGQVLTTGADCQDLVEEYIKKPPNVPEAPFWLTRLLYRAAKNCPLVWLVDDLDQAEGGTWSNFLWEFAPQMSQDLPMLFVATLNGKREFDDIEKSDSELRKAVSRILTDGRAEWHFVEPLTKTEVENLLSPTDWGIAAHLHGVTGGKFRWVRELWSELRREEVVIWSDEKSCWIWSPVKTRSLNLYDSILNDKLKQLLDTTDSEELATARKILACGALEGVTFTSYALALALGWDAEEMSDYLDVLADETNPSSMLRAERVLQIEEFSEKPRSLWRYTFISEYFRMALLQYELNEAEQLNLRLEVANALIQTYAPEEWRAARRVAELYREAVGFEQGKRLTAETRKTLSERTEKYQNLADNPWILSHEALREYAESLLNINTDDWDKFRVYQAAKILRKAGDVMYVRDSFTRVLKVYERLAKLWKRVGLLQLEIEAIIRSGYCYTALGEIETAKSYGEKCLALSQKAGDKWGQGASWWLLGDIAFGKREFKQAREHAEQSLKIYGEIGHQQGLANSFILLGRIELQESNYQQAREHAEQALKISRARGSKHDELMNLHALGLIAQKESDFRLARQHAEQALNISGEIADKQGEGANFYLLGSIAYELGKLPEALRLFSISLQITSGLNDSTHVERASSDIAEVSSTLEYSPEQTEQVSAEAAEAYRKDKCASLIERTFADLPRLSN